MFDEHVVLLKIGQSFGRNDTLCNKTTCVEYEGIEYTIRIEPILKKKNLIFPDEEKYVWVIYVNQFDKDKNKNIVKMIAYSKKEYCYEPAIMERDAFNCIQNIGKIMQQKF